MRNFRLDDESGHQEALFEWAAYHIERRHRHVRRTEKEIR